MSSSTPATAATAVTETSGGASTEKVFSVISLVSTGIILIGALFPLYQFDFSPPQGHMMLNGVELYAFHRSFSLIAPLQGSEAGVNAIHSAIFGLVLGNLLQDVPTVLTNSKLLLALLGHRITQIIFGSFSAFAVAVQTVAMLGAIIAYTAKPQITTFWTTSPSEYSALQYYHPSFGFGFYLVTIGFVIALLLAMRNLGFGFAVLLLIVTFVLFITGSFSAITHFYEFLNRLDPLQLIGL